MYIAAHNLFLDHYSIKVNANMTTAPATPSRAKAAAPAKAIAKPAEAKPAEVKAVVAKPVEAVAESVAPVLNTYEDAVGFGKDAIEAWVQAGTILSKGFQDIGSTVFGFAQSMVEENVAVSKQLMAAKTLRDVVDLQTTFSRAQFDRLVSEGSHLSDLSVKLVEESFAPIGQKVNSVIDKFVSSAA